MSAPDPSHPGVRPVALWPVLLVVVVDVFGMTLVLPLLAIYAETFSASPLQASLLVTTFAACQFLSAPLIGQLSDRIGRKPMLILSQLGTCVGFIVMAQAQSLGVLYLARMIDGATAGNIALAQSYIADHTRPEDRTKAFGLIGAAFGFGFFVGPALSGLLSSQYGLTAPIWLAASMSATSILCSAVLLDNAQVAAPGPRPSMLSWRTYAAYLGRPVLGRRLVQFWFYALSFSTFLAGFALFAERRFEWNGAPFGPREIGVVLALVGLIGIVVQAGLLGRLVKTVGEQRLAGAAFSALVVGFAALGLVRSVPALVLCAIAMAFGNAVLRPVLTSLLSQAAARHEQGAIAGLTASFVSLASIVAPLCGGLLIEHGWLAAWAFAAAAMAAVSAAIGRSSVETAAPHPPLAGENMR